VEPYVLSTPAFESHTGTPKSSDKTITLQEGDEALPNWPRKRRLFRAPGCWERQRPEGVGHWGRVKGEDEIDGQGRGRHAAAPSQSTQQQRHAGGVANNRRCRAPTP